MFSFNTGRLYDSFGQLIFVERITPERVAFFDVSRNIDGVVTTISVTDHGMQHDVMAAYDQNRYEPVDRREYSDLVRRVDVANRAARLTQALLEGAQRQLELAAAAFQQIGKLRDSPAWNDTEDACRFQARQLGVAMKRIG